MKKKLAIAFLVLVAGYITWEQVKGNIFTWYAVHMMARETDFPATDKPDQLTLTWAGDAATTQAINWRTANLNKDGWAQYRKQGDTAAPMEVKAERVALTDKALKNDPTIDRFTAYLKDLSPATAYEYRVGDKAADAWTEWRSFKTAVGAGQPFSFLYLGDAQVGLEYYGDLLHRALEKAPDVSFGIVAGDLVNSGACRNEWDVFFNASSGVFDRKTIVPCLGNHDYQKQEVPEIYLSSFALPLNGPKDFPAERAYSFVVGDALFVVLDSNLPAEKDQAQWLEKTLKNATQKWKIALYHHPAYCSAPNRDNDGVFDVWSPLFDKYHVDVALQGHDHAYLRTYPMKAGKRAASAAEGTYYVVTVSGTKYYEQVQHDYAEVAFTEVSTYQVIDVTPSRFSYKAYDYDHQLRDEFSIEK